MIDAHSPTWIEIKKWADERVETARLALEATGLDPAQTEYQRGIIAAIKELVGLTEPGPSIPKDGTSYT